MYVHRLQWTGLLLIAGFTILGCYDAQVPLGFVEEAPINLNLAGRWEPLPGQSEDELLSLRILPFNEHEYYLEYWSLSNPEERPEILRMRAFTTQVEGVSFANIQLIEDDEEEGYLIVHFDLSEEDILSIRFVSEKEIEDIATSEELYEFVRQFVAKGGLEKEDVMHFRKAVDR